MLWGFAHGLVPGDHSSLRGESELSASICVMTLRAYFSVGEKRSVRDLCSDDISDGNAPKRIQGN